MDLQVKKRQRPSYLLPQESQNKKLKMDTSLSKKVENTSRPIMVVLNEMVSGTEHSDEIDFRWKKASGTSNVIPANKGKGRDQLFLEPFYLLLNFSSVSSEINLSSTSDFLIKIKMTKKSDSNINFDFKKFEIAKNFQEDLAKNILKIAVLRNNISGFSSNNVCTKTDHGREHVTNYLQNEYDLDVILNVDDKIYKFSVPIILMSISAFQVSGNCYRKNSDKKDEFNNLLNELAGKATGPILQDAQTSNHLESFKRITTNSIHLTNSELPTGIQNFNFSYPYSPDLFAPSPFLFAPVPLFWNQVPWIPVSLPWIPVFSPPPAPVLFPQKYENYIPNSETETVLMPELNELNSMNELTQTFNSHELYRDIDLNSTDDLMEELTPELNGHNALYDQSTKEINSQGFYQDFDLNLTCEQMMDLF